MGLTMLIFSLYYSRGWRLILWRGHPGYEYRRITSHQAARLLHLANPAHTAHRRWATYNITGTYGIQFFARLLPPPGENNKG